MFYTLSRVLPSPFVDLKIEHMLMLLVSPSNNNDDLYSVHDVTESRALNRMLTTGHRSRYAKFIRDKIIECSSTTGHRYRYAKYIENKIIECSSTTGHRYRYAKFIAIGVKIIERLSVPLIFEVVSKKLCTL